MVERNQPDNSAAGVSLPLTPQDGVVFVPTAIERDLLSRAVTPALYHELSIEICGFGPIAAAARSAKYLFQQSPAWAILVGIAGAYAEQCRPGSAWTFSSVQCWGIGAGEGEHWQSATDLGWHQWADDKTDEPPVADQLPLQIYLPEILQPQLLTATSASGSTADAARRQRYAPSAAAEDMEGYGVALSCHWARVPLGIVRGISNLAGNRDHSAWQTQSAMDSCAVLLMQLLAPEN